MSKKQETECAAEIASDLTSRPSWASDAGGAHDQTMLENWLFHVRCERFCSRTSGKRHDFYVIHTSDGVQVLAVTPDDELVMVRQFRAGSRRDSLELPGGLIEAGEDPCVAGMRELLEETGYVADAPRPSGMLYSNPAILTMRTTTVLAHGAKQVAAPSPDHSEELVIELVKRSEVMRLIRTGAIDHSTSVAGLLWWLMLDQPASPSGPD
jgi:8-oxo-dGTP pyrophosphatase MutT (NUDIX family)